MPRRGFCVANVQKIHVHLRVRTDFLLFHRSQRARVTWFFRPYTRARRKMLILGPSILGPSILGPWFEIAVKFFSKFFKNKFYPSATLRKNPVGKSNTQKRSPMEYKCLYCINIQLCYNNSLIGQHIGPSEVVQI